MELDQVDRLMLMNVLPETGDLTTIKIVQDLHNALGFSEEEIAELGMQNVVRNGNAQVIWNEGATLVKDVPIGVVASGLIHDVLAKMHKEKALRINHISLCEKFEVIGAEGAD